MAGRAIGPMLIAIVVGALCIFASLSFVEELSDGALSATWPVTDGMVIEHDITRGCQANSGASPRITYRYRVEGREYTGTRITATDRDCLADEAAALDFLRREYPLGAKVRVHYDSVHPDSAVLKAGEYSRRGYGLVPAAWIFALLMFRTAWRLWREPAGGQDAVPAPVTLHRKPKSGRSAQQGNSGENDHGQ